MTNRVLIVVFAISVILGLLSGCAGKIEALEKDIKKPEPLFRASMFELKESYALGSSIEFIMVIYTDPRDSATLVFPSTCPAEFIVYHDGEAIWNSLEGAACLQMLNEITYPPAETLNFTSLWNCTTSSWKGVNLGYYSVQGILLSNPPVQTPVRTFHLVD